MPPVVQILIWVAIIAVFWMLMIRPTRNRQRATAQLQREISVGDDVMISAGIFGTVRSLDEKRVELEIAPGTTIKVVRQAVLERIQTPPAESVENTDVDKHDDEESE